jgi:hypothetical protein
MALERNEPMQIGDYIAEVELMPEQGFDIEDLNDLVGERTKEPESLRSFYVLTYDDDGRESESAQRGHEALARAVLSLALVEGAARAAPVATSTSSTTQVLQRVGVVVDTRSVVAPA